MIDDHNSPLVRTVRSTGFPNVATRGGDPFFVGWNDQPHTDGSKVGSSYAHAKVRE